jgi:hypothetical protein
MACSRTLAVFTTRLEKKGARKLMGVIDGGTGSCATPVLRICCWWSMKPRGSSQTGRNQGSPTSNPNSIHVAHGK